MKIKGNIEFEDSKEKFKIFSDQGTYFKQQEKVFTEGNSKAINENGDVISAHKFEYDKNLKIIIATENIEFENIKLSKIFSFSFILFSVLVLVQLHFIKKYFNKNTII